MLLTVDEAKKLKPNFAQIRELKNEYTIYRNTISIFAVWFFILTTARLLFVCLAIVSMFNQNPDLANAWSKGGGGGFFLFCLLVSCIPLIGNVFNIIMPILVIISAFLIGGGIMSNFTLYILPIVIAYVAVFGLIFCSNLLFSLIIKLSCPKIYKEIEYLSSTDEIMRMFYNSTIPLRNAAYSSNGQDEKTDKKEQKNK